MAEYGYNEVQTVQPGAAAILNDIRPCTRCPQLVLHENQSPNMILRGIVRNVNCCNPKAQYNVSYSGNIAVPTGTAPGEIQLAISVNGFIRPLTISAATPAAAEEYWHVSGDTTIDVAAGCCTDIAIVNASVSVTPATTPASPVLIRNLNVRITRNAA